MESILDITSMAFGGDAVKRLSSVLHESPTATQRAVDTALPASLAGLAFASNESKAAELLGAFRGGNYPHVDAGEVARVIGDASATTRLAQSGQGFLSQMFGGKLGGIVEALAGQAGVSRSSASTLLGLAAPLVLNAIGKEATSQNLDAGGLSRLLADQGRKVSGLLPSSMTSALSVLGPGLGEASIPRVREAQNYGAMTDDQLIGRNEIEPRTNPLWLILPLAALALLGLWLFNRARQQRNEQQHPTVEQPAFRNAPANPNEPAQPRNYNR